MKTVRGPAIVLGLLYLGLLGFLAASADELPARVATHFNWHGQPNGWMSRPSHLLFTSILGTVIPLLPVVLLFFTRFLPDRSINLPHREYWLAPERRAETLAYLRRQSLWFACIMVCFVAGVHYLILRANAQATVRLATPLLLTLLGLFLAALTTWAVRMIRHFRRIPEATAVQASPAK